MKLHHNNMWKERKIYYCKKHTKIYFITRHIQIFPREPKSVRGKKVDGQTDVNNQN